MHIKCHLKSCKEVDRFQGKLGVRGAKLGGVENGWRTDVFHEAGGEKGCKLLK